MWISRVDEVENNKDKAQISNPFMLQNGMNNLKSPFSAGQMRSAGKAVSAATPGNDMGVIVSISSAGRSNKAATYATTLSGIDTNLFSAD